MSEETNARDEMEAITHKFQGAGWVPTECYGGSRAFSKPNGELRRKQSKETGEGFFGFLMKLRKLLFL